MEAVGLYLRTLRDAAELTQAKAASRVGLAAKTIERWEAGKNEPKLTELSTYVKTIGGSVQQIVNLLLDLGPEEETMPASQLSERQHAILSQMSTKELDTLITFVEQTRRT